MFSEAQFEALITEVKNGLKSFSSDLDEMVPAGNAAVNHWYVLPPVAEAVMWTVNETVKWGKKMLNWLLELLEGVAAPVFMAIDAWHWADIKGGAFGVRDALSSQRLVVDDSDWSGKARNAYVAAASAQSAAAGRVGTVAKALEDNLLASAVAGGAFYAAIGAIVAKLSTVSAASLVALGSGIFSAVGIGLLLEEAGVNTALVWAAIGALTAFLGTQVNAIIKLHDECVDPTSFPGGKWPSTGSAGYNNSTINGGGNGWVVKPS